MKNSKLKYQMVKEHIEDLLSQKAFSTTTPVTIEEMSQNLGLNSRTIAKGLEPFIEKNILKKVKGKGIFAVDNGKNTWEECVGLLMPFDSHFYTGLYDAIVELLTAEGISSFALNPQNLDDDGNASGKMKDFISRNPKALIIDGTSYFRRTYLHLDKEVKTIFVNHFDAPGDLPGSGILIDYGEGIYKATVHFLELGHRNIVFGGFQPRENLVVGTSHRSNNSYYKALRGYRRAMTEAGLTEKEEIFWCTRHDQADPDTELHQLMTKKEQPSAFVCFSDSYAADLMRKVQKMGFQVPNQVTFTGFLNTPWTEHTSVPLSSMKINTEKVAKLVMTEVMSEPWTKTVYKIQPELVIRESSGKKKGK